MSSKEFQTTVRSFPGATSEDLKDYIKPLIKKKPDTMILHVGTNDLTKNINNTIENLSCITSEIKRISPETNVVFSNLCLREDKPGLSSKVKNLNMSIDRFCKDNGLNIINNSNIDKNCLSRKKLHLNEKGLSKLAVNLKVFIQNNL